MSSEVLVSRPRCDSRCGDRGDLGPPGAPGGPGGQPSAQPSSGSATAGYRSAKYTPDEWFSHYHGVLQQAAGDRLAARSIQRESRSLMGDSEADWLSTQAGGTRLLGERLQDIHCWQSELRRHMERLQGDTDSLLALKRRLEKALDASRAPLAIASDNLSCRARRPAPELVRDSVEEELLQVSCRVHRCRMRLMYRWKVECNFLRFFVFLFFY